MPMIRAQSSSVASRNWPALLMPALLNMTSRRPKERTAPRIIALTLARSVTFTCKAIASPPSPADGCGNALRGGKVDVGHRHARLRRGKIARYSLRRCPGRCR